MGRGKKKSDFKVIRRIPLSRSIVSKNSYTVKDDSYFKKLEKFKVDLSENKVPEMSSKGFDEVKKIDLKIDLSDIPEELKDYNPFRKKEVVEHVLSVSKSDSSLSKDSPVSKDASVSKDSPVSKDASVSKETPVSKDASVSKDAPVSKETLNLQNIVIPKKLTSEEFNKKESQKKIPGFNQVLLNSPEIVQIDNSIKNDIYFDESNNNKKTMALLKSILDDVSTPHKITPEKSSNNVDLLIKSKNEDVDNLLDQLNQKTSKLDEEVFLESFSFLDDKPKVRKVSFPEYNVKNLYSKIDSLSQNKKKEISPITTKEEFSDKKDSLNIFPKDTSIKDKSQENYNTGLFEEIEVPDIFAIEDDVKNLSETVEDKFSSYDDEKVDVKVLNQDSDFTPDVLTNEASEKIPNFVMDGNKVKLNSEIKENISKIINSKNKDLDSKDHLDADEFNEQMIEDEKETKDLISKADLSKEDDDKIYKGYKKITSSRKKEASPSKDKTIKEKETKEIISQEDLTEDDDFEKIESPRKQQYSAPREKEIKIIKEVKLTPKVKTDLIAEKFSDLREKGIDYILPKDAGKNTVKINKEIYQEQLSSDNSLFSSLVYQDPVASFKEDIKNIFDKYSIDDFTYVSIYYDKNKGLFYNLVQPELNTDQEKEYVQLKKIFFNTIDKNYYSFNGDKHSLDKYIEKIFDISVEKLSYSIGKLQRKLYLKFIQREFFGLGILTNVLLDKKIIEVSCSGEKSNIIVYHVEYGVLKTNISFKNIADLNNFVTILTKNMGIYITQEHPVIDGYLPNGYKVEGLFSMGDTSSKGSSFVIKKYLDEPLTPVSLVNTSVGSVDVFSYIWSAISEDFKVVLKDIDDSFVIFNSILLFYPDSKIITIQAYDRFKLPQKEWINRIFTNNVNISKKIMIEQTISQKPEFIAVDEFGEDVFDVSWYNLNIFSIKPEVSDKFIEQLKMVNHKSIVIDVKRIKQGFKETFQIVNIKEIINKKENVIIDLDVSENKYNINLLSSSINVVDFLKKKKLMRWMKDSKVYNYKDFNSIVSQYKYEKDNLFKRLDIK